MRSAPSPVGSLLPALACAALLACGGPDQPGDRPAGKMPDAAGQIKGGSDAAGQGADVPGAPSLPTPPPQAGPAAPRLTLSAAALEFGTQTIGATGAAMSITVTNMGSAAAEGATVTLAEPEFRLTTTCMPGRRLGVLETCSVSVFFEPRSAGAKRATITVQDKTKGAAPLTIAATGTGRTPPDAGVVDAGLDAAGASGGADARGSIDGAADGARDK